MEIINKSANLNNEDKTVKSLIYNLTSAGVSTNVFDHAGETVHVEAWVHFNQEKNDGSTREVLSFINSDGEVFGTISATFIKRFLDIYLVFGEEDFPDLAIVKGVSKNGAEFVTCKPA